MPAHQCFRLDDGHCLQNRREPAIKQNEEQPVAIREPHTTAHLALKNGNMLPERGILCLKLGLHLGWQHQQSQENDEQRDHCRVTLRDSVAGLSSPLPKPEQRQANGPAFFSTHERTELVRSRM